MQLKKTLSYFSIMSRHFTKFLEVIIQSILCSFSFTISLYLTLGFISSKSLNDRKKIFFDEIISPFFVNTNFK